MANVLVTGGAGFIGSHLVDELVKQGHKVTILDNFISGSKDYISSVKGKVTFVKGDVRDLYYLQKVVEEMDFIFHLAALASVQFSVENPLETHQVNSTGTINVMVAAKDAGVKRVIYVSSASVYGDDPDLPKTESSKICPLTPYGLTKLSAEQYAVLFAKLYNLEAVGLRFFNVYGPRQDPSSPYSGVISKFIDAMSADRQPVVFGDGEQTRDFVYVTDAVQALIASMTAKNVSGEVMNIATGSQVTLNELIKLLNELLGKSIKPLMKDERPGDIKHSVADISKAKKLLKYNPSMSFKDGLKNTIEHP